jgi:hypothetical protein
MLEKRRPFGRLFFIADIRKRLSLRTKWLIWCLIILSYTINIKLNIMWRPYVNTI